MMAIPIVQAAKKAAALVKDADTLAPHTGIGKRVRKFKELGNLVRGSSGPEIPEDAASTVRSWTEEIPVSRLAQDFTGMNVRDVEQYLHSYPYEEEDPFDDTDRN